MPDCLSEILQGIRHLLPHKRWSSHGTGMTLLMVDIHDFSIVSLLLENFPFFILSSFQTHPVLIPLLPIHNFRRMWRYEIYVASMLVTLSFASIPAIYPAFTRSILQFLIRSISSLHFRTSDCDEQRSASATALRSRSHQHNIVT